MAILGAVSGNDRASDALVGDGRKTYEEVRRHARETFLPLSTTLELTLQCNLRCVHCYNFDRDEPRPSFEALRRPRLPIAGAPEAGRDGKPLSDVEVVALIDDLHDAGCVFLAFSGGEALVHPSLLDFVRHARSRGLVVTLKTNGLLLVEMSAALAAAGAGKVEVSLYGAQASTHDAFVQVPGSFERTVAGIRAARAAGLEARISFVLSRRNAEEVPEMLELAKSLDVRCGMDPHLTARYDDDASSARAPADLRVDREILERLYRGPFRGQIKPGQDRGVQCSCATAVCGISAFGEVYPCIGAPIPSGNIRDRSFREIWKESPTLNWIRGLRLEDFAACSGCEHRPWCRRSSGVLYLNTGSYTGPARFGDDLTCVDAEVRHSLAAEPVTGEGAETPVLRRHSED